MADTQDDCIFCKIGAGEIPADVVYEDHFTVAFRDLHPQAPTHVLVIPRRHMASPDEITDDDGEMLSAMFRAVREVAAKEGLSGYRIVSNVGAEAGQSVFHLHLHVLGGRAMRWPPG